MMTDDENSSSWIYKTKEHGMTSATASLGMISLWDIEVGLSLIDKYMYSNDDNIKVSLTTDVCAEGQCLTDTLHTL